MDAIMRAWRKGDGRQKFVEQVEAASEASSARWSRAQFGPLPDDEWQHLVDDVKLAAKTHLITAKKTTHETNTAKERRELLSRRRTLREWGLELDEEVVTNSSRSQGSSARSGRRSGYNDNTTSGPSWQRQQKKTIKQ